MPEPVSLDEAKAHLGVESGDWDTLIERLITAAREWVENYTGLVLVRRQMTQQFDTFGAYLALWRRPVVSIDGLSYFDVNGAEQTYSGAVERLNRFPVRIYPAAGTGWPSLSSDGGDVVVTYTVGCAAGEEPRTLLQAILLLVAHWFAHREAGAADDASEVPFAVTALCDQHRMPVL
jgi:uncharacterized phiE125 gp8 family phage protein